MRYKIQEARRPSIVDPVGLGQPHVPGALIWCDVGEQAAGSGDRCHGWLDGRDPTGQLRSGWRIVEFHRASGEPLSSDEAGALVAEFEAMA